MNIKDSKFRRLDGIIFVGPDGELIEGDFHDVFAANYFGMSLELSDKEDLAGKERFETFDKCRDQLGYYNVDMTNFLVQFYGFDRIGRNWIISAKENLNEFYFNWLLEGYKLEHIRPIRFDHEKNFYYPKTDIDVMTRDFEIKREAVRIRTNTPKNELPRYYR